MTIKEIRDFPDDVSWADHPYAMVTIGTRRLGRSPRIDPAAESLDLSADARAWTVDVPARSGEAIPFRLELFDERGDEGSTRLATVDGTLSDPWTPGTRELTGSPTLVVEIDTVRVKPATATAHARRSKSPDEPSGTVRVRRGIALELVEIQGLYKPTDTPPATDADPAWRARYHHGYTSDDHQGRVYINRDLTGAWTKGTQLIQLTVEIHLFATPLPPGTTVKWSVLDPDDPSNDDPDVHSQWGQYYDPLDYDTSGVHLGSTGEDNARMFDEDGTGTRGKIFGESLPPWEGVSGYALSAATDTGATTTIDGESMTSEVRLHCPNVGGANLIVRAELDPKPPMPAIPAQTGMITMWKRIDVEVARMDGAPTLRPVIEEVAEAFESACVQLDFHPETPLANNRRQSPDPMAPTEKKLFRFNKPWKWTKRVFEHRKDPGWFFLGSALRPYNPDPEQPTTVFSSDIPGSSWSIRRWTWNEGVLPIKKRKGEELEIDAVIKWKYRRQIESVFFSWALPNQAGDVQSLYFSTSRVKRHGATTRVGLEGHDIVSGFTGHDSNGSIEHAYESEMWFYPQGVVDTMTDQWRSNTRGYDIPADAECIVVTKDPSLLAGISPSRGVGANSYFAGRTIVFSDVADFQADPDAFYDRARRFVVHEFGHAFGMPHKCGFHDDRAPRENSCAMNYWNHWLLEDGHVDRLEPLTAGKMGSRLCGRHAMEIRRVHLENSKGLRWKS